MRKSGPVLLLILGLVGLDQLTKWLIVRSIPLYGSVPVVPGFFNLTRIHNKGAIFGFFSRSATPLTQGILAGVALAALALVVLYFLRTPASESLMRISLALILAGAIGNQVDRLARGYVVDFLDLYVNHWHWPFFNVADSCITIGAALLLVRLFRRQQHAADPV